MRGLSMIASWLMAPFTFATNKAKEVKRRLAFRLLRSRGLFFLILIPVTWEALSPALVSSWKVFHPPGDVRYWLVVALAIVQWLYFLTLLIVATPKYVWRPYQLWRERDRRKLERGEDKITR